MARKKKDTIKDQIGKAWSRLASGVQIKMLDTPAIFREIEAAVATGVSLDDAILAAIPKWRQN